MLLKRDNETYKLKCNYYLDFKLRGYQTMEITQALKEKIHEVAVLLAMDTRDDLNSTRWTEYAEKAITKRLKELPDITAEAYKIEWVKERAIKIYKSRGYGNCIGSVEKVLNELLNPVIEEIEAAYKEVADKKAINKLIDDDEFTVKPEGVFVGDEKIGEYVQRFTLEQVEEILTNMGHDVTCGTCMEIAFTGGGSGHEHTCNKKICNICGSTDQKLFDNPACGCLNPQTVFPVNVIPEKVTEVFKSIDTNTYDSIYNHQTLWNTMRIDLKILREYIEHIVPDIENLDEKAYARIALETIQCMCGGDFQIDDTDKFVDGIYRAAHTALGTCDNEHEDWTIQIQELWESFNIKGML